MRVLATALEAPPTDAELGRAISAYKKSFYGRVEAVQSRASTLAGYYQHTGRADYLDQDLERYVKASPEAVHQAAKRYLNLTQFVRLDIVPGGKEAAVAKPALDTDGKVTPAPAAKPAAGKAATIPSKPATGKASSSAPGAR
jgi:hypothetical protein